MKIRVLILCFSFLAGFIKAQETYSFISDRRFKDPSELIGYNFKPVHLEVPNEYDEEIAVGEYSFGVTMNNLYVNGPEIKGVYSINNINPAEYGFRLNLMNARDPTIQGHLKVILTPKRHVEALVFKRSNKDKEIIFFLPELTKKQAEMDDEYFTDKYEVELEAPDSIWGKTIRPFMLWHQSDNIQQRLTYGDSTVVSFEEIYRVVDKTKKIKKKKDKAAEKLVNTEAEATQAEKRPESEETAATEEVAEETEPTEEELEAIRIDENLVKVAEIMKLSSLKEIEEAIAELDEDFQKKVKVVKEYFIIMKSNVKYDDGTTELKTKKNQLKKWTQREDEMSGQPGAERYQIDFLTSKGDHIYLYLTGRKTISSFEMNTSKYLMWGH